MHVTKGGGGVLNATLKKKKQHGEQDYVISNQYWVCNSKKWHGICF